MQIEQQTFWEHLDVLRGCILRIMFAVVLGAVVAFCVKEPLFDIVLAPSRSNFFVYQLMGAEPFHIQLINTGLAEQMLIHLKVAFSMGVLVASPYIIYVLFGFVSPALYDNERRLSLRLTLSAYLMFIIGLAINYLIIFPLTVRFLGTYQISDEVQNMLSISSYIDTMMMMSLIFGIVFEIPVLSWLLAKLGLLKADWMIHFRRHAIVIILVVAAIITPTADMFTLLIVSLPIWLLYEISIFIVSKTYRYVEKN